MIVLNLTCNRNHPFEGWFASAEAFDCQASGGQVNCPTCGSAEVSRLPSGPRVISHPSVPAKAGVELTAADMTALVQAITTASEAEDVAERFPEEARKIHYGEAPLRGIRGQASLADTLELLDEGIPVLPLPLPGKKHIH